MTERVSRNVPTGEYDASAITVLEGLEAVRKRPGMYIGSTDTRGLMHCLWELIDNSVDEALAGHAERVDVLLHPDGSAEVRDDGRGVPVDTEPRTGLSGVEVVFTKLHAGGKFGGASYAASGGLHGVGASVVNALSSRLDVAVDRGGRTHSMSFRRGEPGEFDDADEASPDSVFVAFTDDSRLQVGGKVPRAGTGT
ncbi:MAG: ATP-binding protein, partial [Nocardioides sp.]